MSPIVAVMRNRYVKSGPDGERVYSGPLWRALLREYSSDAHFSCYPPLTDRRLVQGDIGKCPITLGALVLDIDCPEVHGSKDPAPARWRDDLDNRIAQLFDEHGPGFAYGTRGGARIVYELAEPFSVTSLADADEWKRRHAVTLAYLSRRFNIDADDACNDWSRLYRLPFATREPGVGPESWPTRGDAHHIGAFTFEPSSEDIETARASSKAFNTRRTDLTFDACGGDGRGLLYHVLRARGDLIRPHGGGYVIRCPRESEHSTGRSGDGSTLLYMPARGAEIGAIHCLHAHCSRLSVRDWLRVFSDHELAEARRAAGIVRAA